MTDMRTQISAVMFRPVPGECLASPIDGLSRNLRIIS